MKALLISIFRRFHPDQLKPILDERCAIRVISKGQDAYIGIGKLKWEYNSLKVFFERVAHIETAPGSPGYADWNRPPPIVGTQSGYTMKFQPTGVNLKPLDWQIITVGKDEKIKVSFTEAETVKIDGILDSEITGS